MYRDRLCAVTLIATSGTKCQTQSAATIRRRYKSLHKHAIVASVQTKSRPYQIKKPAKNWQAMQFINLDYRSTLKTPLPAFVVA